MKNLFITTFLLLITFISKAQEQFSGNWEPVNRELTIYSKNINILLGDVIIWSYATKLDWINDSSKNPEKIFDKSAYKLRDDIYEQVTYVDNAVLKSVVYNTKNNWKVFKEYKLSKNKQKLVANYSGDWAGKVVYQRKK